MFENMIIDKLGLNNSTKKKKTPIKKVANHQTYAAMIASALTALKDRKGSSKIAIEKYIRANCVVGGATANEARGAIALKLALKRGVESGALVQVKGQGASGSFKLGKIAKPIVKKAAVKKVVQKVAVKKVAAKKPAVKKAPMPSGKPKKAMAKKVAKKVAKKPVAKKVLKPVAVAKKAPKPAAKKAKK